MYEFIYIHPQTIIETANFSFQFKKNFQWVLLHWSHWFCWIRYWRIIFSQKIYDFNDTLGTLISHWKTVIRYTVPYDHNILCWLMSAFVLFGFPLCIFFDAIIRMRSSVWIHIILGRKRTSVVSAPMKIRVLCWHSACTPFIWLQCNLPEHWAQLNQLATQRSIAHYPE